MIKKIETIGQAKLSIYRNLVKQYGKKQGLVAYNYIKYKERHKFQNIAKAIVEKESVANKVLSDINKKIPNKISIKNAVFTHPIFKILERYRQEIYKLTENKLKELFNDSEKLINQVLESKFNNETTIMFRKRIRDLTGGGLEKKILDKVNEMRNKITNSLNKMVPDKLKNLIPQAAKDVIGQLKSFNFKKEIAKQAKPFLVEMAQNVIGVSEPAARAITDIILILL